MSNIDPRSFVTLEQLKLFWPPANAPQQTNAWTVGILLSSAGVYRVRIEGVPYEYSSPGGESLTDIRDGLLASIAAGPAHPNWVEAPDGVDAFTVVATSAGVTIPVALEGEPVDEAVVVLEDVPVTNLLTDEIMECQLELLHCEFNRGKWGCALWRGHLSLAIHTLRCWQQGASGGGAGVPTGTITSLTQGPYSAGFAAPGGGDSADGGLNSTKEGQEYLRLRDSLGPCARPLRSGRRCIGGRAW